MAKDDLSGKLAVILHADVAGSTQLVQQDEQLAHERIRDAFRRFSVTIEKYHGRVQELRGDALLAEFERASDAVTAALAFQLDHHEHLEKINDDIQPKIRVGIALGEVVIADSTVTGAGVVLAQRVEQLAEPGGLCITSAIHEALPNRLPLSIESLGEQTLKGFDEHVRVYQVQLGSGESVPSPQQKSHHQVKPKNWWQRTAIVVAVLVVVSGIGYWSKYSLPQEEPVSIERMAFPLPDKPSIAVLPFTNMSDDPKQEYFVDGMTEDLITDLSKISGLFVIARNSTFSYKGKPVKVRQVAEELGVRYVLEGSMRRDGNQVRINAQLIDAITGGHLWAERYDGSIDNVFELQDKVTRQIVTALAVNLTTDEDELRGKGKTNIPEAYDAFLQGRAHFRQNTRKDIAFALDYFNRAVELDPNYTHAFAAISQVYTVATSRSWHVRLGWCRAPYRAESFLQLSMKNPTALTHRAASLLRSHQGRHKEALEEAAKMMVLDPNDAENFDVLGEALVWAGRPEEAIEAYEKAMRLDPHYPAQYLEGVGIAYFNTGQIEMAEEALARARNLNPSIAAWTHIAVLGLLGRKDEATAIHEQYLKLRKLRHYSVDKVVGWYPYKRREDVERLGSGLIKAGFCCQDRLEQYLTTTPRAQESFTRLGC